MTRKDYQKITAAFRSTYLPNLTDNEYRECYNNGVTNALNNIANVLERDNPNFDRTQFINAASKNK